MKQAFRRSKNKPFFNIGLIFLFVLLFSCNNDDSVAGLNEEFITYISGEWEVEYYSYASPNSPDTTNIDIFLIDSRPTFGYQYIIPINPDSSYIDSQEFGMSDSNFCKLSKVDKLQHWSFIVENDILKLNARVHCGGHTENFEVGYTNLRYMNNNRQSRAIIADLSMVSLQSEYIVNDVIVYNGHEFEGTSFNFATHGDVDEYFHFVLF